MLGMHGAAYTNTILDEADLLVAVGVRFDDRATGKATEFCRHATIAHIDVDPSEIGKIKPANLGIRGDAKRVLAAVFPRVREQPRAPWRARVGALKAALPLPRADDDDPSRPTTLLRRLGGLLPSNTIITTDVGQHQMWVAQVYPFREPRTLQSSGGLGTMGFGLPAAIGAALARPEVKTVCVSGDGSFLMNIQELATAAELGVNVTVLVLDNHHLGMVRQQQELFYGGRYHGSRFDATPDFATIARGFGVPSVTLDWSVDPIYSLESAIEQRGPSVVIAPIDHAEKVLPMVAPGKPNREMIGAFGDIGERTAPRKPRASVSRLGGASFGPPSSGC